MVPASRSPADVIIHSLLCASPLCFGNLKYRAGRASVEHHWVQVLDDDSSIGAVVCVTRRAVRFGSGSRASVAGACSSASAAGTQDGSDGPCIAARSALAAGYVG